MGRGCKKFHCFTLALAAVLPLAQAEPLKDALSQAEQPTANSPFFGEQLSDMSIPAGTATGQVTNLNAANLSQNQVLQDLYAGVVVNQTLTMVGQDFYQYFVAAWRDKPLSERYTISVHERPSARLGSQVWVEYANRRVFQTFLPPARAKAREAGLDAVEAAYQNIVEADVVNLLMRDPDLGPDELRN